MKTNKKLQDFLKEHAPEACDTPHLENILMQKINEIDTSHDVFLQKERVRQKKSKVKLFQILALAAAFLLIISSWGVYEISNPATDDAIDDYLAEVFLSPTSDFIIESDLL